MSWYAVQKLSIILHMLRYIKSYFSALKTLPHTLQGQRNRELLPLKCMKALIVNNKIMSIMLPHIL